MEHIDKIKKGLECCLYFDKCDECPYVEDIGCNAKQMTEDTLACIQQLEAKDVEKDRRIAELEQELAAVKKERDKAVRWLTGNCNVCRWAGTEKCDSCDEHEDPWYDDGTSNWEWEGVCPDTEVQEDGNQ